MFIKDANPGPDFLEVVVAVNITGGNYFRFSFLQTKAKKSLVCPGRSACSLECPPWFRSRRDCTAHVTSRIHITKLFEIGKEGFSLLLISGRYKDGYLPGKVAYYNALKPYFKNLELKLIERGGSYVIFLENPTGVMDAIEESELYGCRREADYSSSALTRPPGSTSFFAKAFFLSPFFRQIFAVLSVNLCESTRQHVNEKIKINITKLAGGWLIESCAGFSTV